MKRIPPVEYVLLVISVAAVLALYLPTLSYPFQFDDYGNITQNTNIQISSLDTESLSTAAQGLLPRRPVSNLGFGLSHYAFGLDPSGFRMVNILLHLLNSLLVYSVAKTLLRLANWKKPSAGITAAAGALLWAIHPIHVTSVVYIVQRMNLQASFFMLASLQLYLYARVHRKFIPAVLAGFAGLLALGSKETAFMLPVLIVVMEWLVFRGGSWSWIFKRGLPYAAGFLLLGGGLLFGFNLDRLRRMLSYIPREFSPGERLLTESRVVIDYLGLVFVPSANRLTLDHEVVISKSLASPPTTFICVLLLCGAVAAFVLLVKSGRRLPALGIAWFAILIFLESSFVPLELMFEHRVYLASAGPIALVTAWTLHRLAAHRTQLLAFFILAAGWLVLTTAQYTSVWESELTLWTDAAQKAPGKSRPQQYLADIHADLGHTSLARKHYERALELDPLNVEAMNNYALLYLDQGNPAAARVQAERAVKLSPGFAEAFNTLGLAYASSRDTPEARIVYEKAIELDPLYLAPRNNLANLLASSSDIELKKEAVKSYLYLVNTDPENADFHNNLAFTLSEIGWTEQAAEHYEKAVTLAPEHLSTRLNYGNLLLKEGKRESALEQFEAAASLDPGNTVLQDSIRRLKNASP